MTASPPESVVTEALITAYVRRYHCGRPAGPLLAAIVAKFGPQPDWTEARVAQLLDLFASGAARKGGRGEASAG